MSEFVIPICMALLFGLMAGTGLNWIDTGNAFKIRPGGKAFFWAFTIFFALLAGWSFWQVGRMTTFPIY